jgi:hypothetical protein
MVYKKWIKNWKFIKKYYFKRFTKYVICSISLYKNYVLEILTYYLLHYNSSETYAIAEIINKLKSFFEITF